MSSFVQSRYRIFGISSLIVFFITAIFSEGYYHPDEHFQILEFANYKIGKTPAADLPWEFNERIRPALQPFLAYCTFKGLNSIGITSPFTATFVLRLFAALLSWIVICKIASFLIKDFSTEQGRKFFLFLSLFLWFVPSLSVRFSSENLSAITLTAAIYLLLQIKKDSKRKFWFPSAAGALLGLSFFFRFQIGFAIAGLVLWLFFIYKLHWKQWLFLIATGLAVAAVCLYIDYWFYGEFVLTPVNYFSANIVQNKAANWGTSPWWYYFHLFFLQVVPPLSIALLILLIAGIFKKQKAVFTWILVPFLLAHFAVGHKELRFLFPMIFSFVYLAATAYDYYISKHGIKKWTRVATIIALVINIPLLILKTFTPAQEVAPYYKFLYNYAESQNATLLSVEKSPYDILNLKIHFYKASGLTPVVLKDTAAIDLYLQQNRPASILYFERNLTTTQTFEGYQANKIYSVVPDWILHFNFNNWIGRSRIWSIYELKRIKKKQ